MLIENTFHNIKYVVHSAAIFDPRNSMANTKIKCVTRDKIRHDSWGILQRVPESSSPSTNLNIVKTWGQG